MEYCIQPIVLAGHQAGERIQVKQNADADTETGSEQDQDQII